MCVCVCVCVCVCACVRACVRVCVRACVCVSCSTIAQFVSKKLTHNCFSRLRSINEYLFIDWGGHDRWLGSNIMQQMGTCGPWCPVPELHHSQCTWMTPTKLQVDCSAGPKPPRSA